MKELKTNGWKYVVGLVITAIYLSPLYILVGMAFKSKQDLSSRWMLPGYLHLDNFRTAIEKGGLLEAFQNTVIIMVCAVVLVTVFGAMAAYPLARNRSGFNRFVLLLVLGVMMVPALSILVPLYKLMVEIGGISTYWGIVLVLVTFQLPMSIFLYSNFIVTIPKELDEAAIIDGCSRFGVFYRIVMPLLKPVTASAIILIGVQYWNDFQFSQYLLQSVDMRTITLVISTFFSQSQNNLNGASAGALLAIVPIVAVYLSLQKYFMQSAVDSAIK